MVCAAKHRRNKMHFLIFSGCGERTAQRYYCCSLPLRVWLGRKALGKMEVFSGWDGFERGAVLVRAK